MIPPIIHQMWIGSEIPHRFLDFSSRWRIKHPGWIHVMWSDRGQPMAAKQISDLFPLRNQDLWDRAESLARVPHQFRSDVFRYEILHRFGGVWIDADMEPKRTLDEFLDCELLAGWEAQDKWVGNSILGAEAGHSFLDQVIAQLPINVEQHEGAPATVLSGPQFLTPLIARLPEGTIRLLDQGAFYPYSWAQLERGEDDFPDAIAVHHWNNRRQKVAAAEQLTGARIE